MAKATGKLIDTNESDFIRFQLSLEGSPREVKSGLQRLCAHYEQGRHLADPHPHRLLVRGLLLSSDVLVRRWAYKTIAHLGQPEDAETLRNLLLNEKDIENQTWVMAAVIRLDRYLDVGEICERAHLTSDIPFHLAARLFADKSWLRAHSALPIINIESADSLTLKWAALLSGYDRAPAQLFHPNIENEKLLGELNRHSSSEVAEYSVWALWQNAKFQIASLNVGFPDIRNQPPNVRRWINRLLTKTPTFLQENRDLFQDLRRDSSAPVREGLALGIRTEYLPELNDEMIAWYSDEEERSVKSLLLEYMAAGSAENAAFGEFVEEHFRNAGLKDGTRQRLLSASNGSPLFSALKRIELSERNPDLPLLAPAILINGGVHMSNTSFNAGRDIVGESLVGGDMVNSANNAIRIMPALRENEKEVLLELLNALKGEKDLAGSKAVETIQAIEVVAKDPGTEPKKRLLGSVKNLLPLLPEASSTAQKLTQIADTISKWF